MNNSTTLNSTRRGSSFQHSSSMPLEFQVIVGTIAVVTILANSALIFVLFKQRYMLKKPYNLVILNLAIVDILTGFFIFLTPKLVIDADDFPTSMFHSRVFCYLLASNYIIMVLAKLSIILVTFLAFNRWLSVIHPFRYRSSFTRKHAVVYLSVIWILLFIVSFRSPLAMEFDHDGRCRRVRKPSWSSNHAWFTWLFVYLLITFLIPVILSWLMFAHIYLYLRRIENKDGARNGALKKKRKSLLRMCVVTALVMTVFWAPSEIFLMISVSGTIKITPTFRTMMHDITKTIGFFNSCVNPFIYCLTNMSYRQEFIKVFNADVRRKRINPHNTKEDFIELK